MSKTDEHLDILKTNINTELKSLSENRNAIISIRMIIPKIIQSISSLFNQLKL